MHCNHEEYAFDGYLPRRSSSPSKVRREMTTSTSAVMPLTSDEVQTIVDRASTAISACAMTRSQPLVDRNYSLIGSLRLHRKAFGLDLLRAPANVVLALPYVASQLAAAGLDAAGADRLANRIRRQKIFFDTNVVDELTWRLHTELLELPYDRVADRRGP
ncbi:MAG: DUF6635 family protein [Hyphomicrobiales bacterium]